MIGTHVKTVHRAGVYAERAKDAFTVIYLEAIDAEAFAERVLFLVDIDAIDRAGPDALVTGNAGRQIESMKATVAWSHGYRLFGVFECLRKGFCSIGTEESPSGDFHSGKNSCNRLPDVVKPGEHNRILEVICK